MLGTPNISGLNAFVFMTSLTKQLAFIEFWLNKFPSPVMARSNFKAFSGPIDMIKLKVFARAAPCAFSSEIFEVFTKSLLIIGFSIFR